MEIEGRTAVGGVVCREVGVVGPGAAGTDHERDAGILGGAAGQRPVIGHIEAHGELDRVEPELFRPLEKTDLTVGPLFHPEVDMRAKFHE